MIELQLLEAEEHDRQFIASKDEVEDTEGESESKDEGQRPEVGGLQRIDERMKHLSTQGQGQPVIEEMK
jgi:hypothetical protein